MGKRYILANEDTYLDDAKAELYIYIYDSVYHTALEKVH
jgi:hypothetical protein